MNEYNEGKLHAAIELYNFRVDTLCDKVNESVAWMKMGVRLAWGVATASLIISITILIRLINE